jgi:hypothetical protein
MVEHVILLVSEEKQAKIEIWNFLVPMASLDPDLDLPRSFNLFIFDILNVKNKQNDGFLGCPKLTITFIFPLKNKKNNKNIFFYLDKFSLKNAWDYFDQNSVKIQDITSILDIFDRIMYEASYDHQKHPSCSLGSKVIDWKSWLSSRALKNRPVDRNEPE